MDNNLVNQIERKRNNFNQKLDNLNKSMQSLMMQPVTRPTTINTESSNDRMREKSNIIDKTQGFVFFLTKIRVWVVRWRNISHQQRENKTNLCTVGERCFGTWCQI